VTNVLVSKNPNNRDETVVVPHEVIVAFQLFMGGNKLSGSVVVQFKSGGIAGVVTNTTQVLK
jgi:hypothetical protein